jgi:formylglycine-generating enzyme required for sulfatase activity
MPLIIATCLAILCLPTLAQESRPTTSKPELRTTTAWAEVLDNHPDPGVIPRADHRAAIAATGLPWRVRDKSSGIELLLIPPGTFMMGVSPQDASAEENEKPAHSVTISRPFYLGRFEVSNAEFRRWRPRHASGCWDCRSLNADNQPAARISWDDAKAFCDAYDLRMPTEGEWEYACRAGTETTYPWGEDPNGGAGFANVADRCSARRFCQCPTFRWDDGYYVSSPVGTFRPNGFGLQDTIGNVREWATVWVGSTYSDRAAGVADPQEFASSVQGILRGGSWRDSAWWIRASCRTRPADPSRFESAEGFRVARTP